MERNQYNKYHFGWNIYDVIINLSSICYGFTEKPSISENIEYQTIIKNIEKQMYDIVEKYIYDQLKKENRKLVFSDVREDMVKLIINTMDLGDIYSERLAFIALFNICCKFTTRSSVIDFTWNTFSLKNTK